MAVAILFALFGLSCTSAMAKAPASATPDASTATATNAALDVSYVTLAPGSDASQLTFTWQTASHSDSPLVRIWSGNAAATDFTGTCSASVLAISGLYSNDVTVTGLQANTTYSYQLGDGNGDFSSVGVTTTGDPSAYSYIVVGDPQIGSSGNIPSDTAGWANTLNVISAKFPNAAFVMGTGDQIETTATLAQYTGFFSPTQMQSLPFASCMGNHEGASAGPLAFYNPPNADSAGNYWYTYGNTLYMVWNFNVGTPDSMSAFLASAIAANPTATFRVLTFHVDVYGQGSTHALSDGKAYRDLYVPVIDKYGIDVVFNGHDHTYSRSYPMVYSGSAATSNSVGMQAQTFDAAGASVDPTGTVYFALDSATGSKFYALAAQQPYTAVMAQNDKPMFTVVSVTASTMTTSTYQIEADNSITQIDSYTIKKTVSTSATASVQKLTGNQNSLTVTVNVLRADGTTSTASATVKIDKNSAGTYQVGIYKVYVDTKGNDQVRTCEIVG